MTMPNKVCVTGCSGFLASWVVKACLEKGFIVHGTTRSRDKAEFLTKLDGASERLKIFNNCNLLQTGSFEEAIKGCSTVIHCASPYFFNTTDAGVDKLVKPAIEGTKNVLEACHKLKVEKVVLTSSTAASMIVYGKNDKDYVYSEKDWCDEQLLETKRNYYSLSKTKAERLAWDMTKQFTSFKLSVMNPCIIFGPQLDGQTHLNTSCNTLLSYFSLPKSKQFCVHIVDVRDVADAHVKAASMDLDWAGWGRRNLLLSEVKTMSEVMDILRESKVVPDNMKSTLPTEVDEGIPESVMGAPNPYKSIVDVSQSQAPLEEGGLAMNYRSAKEMIDATILTCLKNGFTNNDKYDLSK